MPSLPIVLSHLAARLHEDGAQISSRALEIMSAAMLFLEAIGNPLNDDVATVAYATSQLKSDDAKQVAVALGVSPDLIPILKPTVIGVDHQLGHVLGKGSRPQAVVAATVLFAWYTMAAKGRNDKRLAALRKIANIATLDGSKNPEIAQALIKEMANVPVAQRPTPVSDEYVFSISIDLVGSTDAKTRVVSLAQGDVGKIDKLNELIYREFCRIERKFYQTAVSHYGTSPAIDPSKFFTVKGIGDEIWILCNASEQEIPAVGHTLIDAAIKVAVQAVNFLATENEDGPSFDKEFDYGRIEPIKSPVKIFMDLVSHASDLGRIRDAMLVQSIRDLLKGFHRREPTPLEIAHVTRRLCLSTYEPMGWSVFQESRSDFIGHEIDRFFRTTKASVPGTVTIGESMALKMGLIFQSAAHDIQSVFTSANTPLTGGLPADQVYTRKRTLNPDQLKGIGYAYDTYTLFAPRSLNAIYEQITADKKNELPVMPYDDLATLIPPDTVRDLVRLILS
jgi:hypothetical protein